MPRLNDSVLFLRSIVMANLCLRTGCPGSTVDASNVLESYISCRRYPGYAFHSLLQSLFLQPDSKPMYQYLDRKWSKTRDANA